jgi:hypothetical protein
MKGASRTLLVQLVLLTLANGWNVYEIVAPGHNTMLYRTLDLFWPISNVFMLATGIMITRANVLRSWSRYAPRWLGYGFR